MVGLDEAELLAMASVTCCRVSDERLDGVELVDATPRVAFRNCHRSVQLDQSTQFRLHSIYAKPGRLIQGCHATA